MIQPITQEGNRQPRSRAERARRLLTGVGIAREDSDDELGSDDLPWEWIYEDGNDTGHRTSSPVGDKFQATSSYQEIESNTPSVGATTANQRCHGRSTSKKPPARIVGAQMGGFRCGLGDCVLLKAEGVREAWVGLICSFEESVGDDDEKLAYIMWFSTEKEIRNKDKKRMDAMQVGHLSCVAASLSSHTYQVLTTTRMSYTSLHPGTLILLHPSMVKPQYCHRLLLRLNIPTARFPRVRQIGGKSSSVDMAVTRERPHTQTSLFGKTSISSARKTLIA